MPPRSRSKKEKALDVLVRGAVEAVCIRLGVHGQCPIAQALVEMAVRRAREPSDDGQFGEPPLAGDREKRVTRPEAKRDKFSELVPEEAAFKLPDVVYPVGIAPYAIRRALIRGMAAHVIGETLGRPVGAGGRTVQDIVTRLTKPGINAPRRKERGQRVASQFEPGTDPT